MFCSHNTCFSVLIYASHIIIFSFYYFLFFPFRIFAPIHFLFHNFFPSLRCISSHCLPCLHPLTALRGFHGHKPPTGRSHQVGQYCGVSAIPASARPSRGSLLVRHCVLRPTHSRDSSRVSQIHEFHHPERSKGEVFRVAVSHRAAVMALQHWTPSGSRRKSLLRPSLFQVLLAGFCQGAQRRRR